MTTILSLASRDFIVVGCDSLATQSTVLVNPQNLIKRFFAADGTLLSDQDGKPFLNDETIWNIATSYPVNQLPSVTKLFDLSPKRAAILFAGASRIGDLSVKNLVHTFKSSAEFNGYDEYTIEGIAERLNSKILKAYEDEYAHEWQRPTMEILLSGYSKGHHEPEIFRMLYEYDFVAQRFNSSIDPAVPRGGYNLLFGGQYDVIQRVVQGIDFESYLSLKSRCHDLLKSYREKVVRSLEGKVPADEVPEIDISNDEFDLFKDDFGGISPSFTDLESLSEQAGIDLVTFLIHTMIKSQEFSSRIPTVGGDIHIGLITSDDGFRWISKEEYKAHEHSTPKFPHVKHNQD